MTSVKKESKADAKAKKKAAAKAEKEAAKAAKVEKPAPGKIGVLFKSRYLGLKIGSGIRFVDGEYLATTAREVQALKAHMEAFPRSVTCEE